MRINDIKVVQQEGFLDFRHIQISKWKETCEDVRQRYGLILPSLFELRLFGREEDLRLLLSPLTITIVLSNSAWLQYKFKPGFITDLASVPKFFRSIIDNDNSKLTPAALVHDTNFTMQFSFLPFKDTNKLFREMAREEGLRFKAWLAYVAVNSIKGKSLWLNDTPLRRTWTRQMVEITHSWPSGCGYVFN